MHTYPDYGLVCIDFDLHFSGSALFSCGKLLIAALGLKWGLIILILYIELTLGMKEMKLS